MIELSPQPAPSVLPCLPAPAEIGDPDCASFAAQLALTTCVMPAPGGKASGKVLPQPGKDLPVVLDPEIFEDPAPEPELALLPAVPIMRPITSKFGLDGAIEPEAALLTPPKSTSSLPVGERSETADTPLAEAIVPTLALVSIASLSSPTPIMASVSSPRTANLAPSVATSLPSAAAQPVAAKSQSENAATGLPAQVPSLHNAIQPTPPHPRIRETDAHRAAEDVPAAQSTSLRNVAPILPAALLPAGALAAAVQLRRGVEPRRLSAGSDLGPAPVAQIKLAATELPNLPHFMPVAPIAIMADGSSVPALSTAPAFGPASPAPATQDFAALIDRIVAARESSSAPVAVAIRHAEFGPVTVRFEQGDNGITVSATSPDPDFARAAIAAMPAERPASFDQSAPRDGGKPSAQPESQPGGNQSGQPRHSAASDRDEPTRNRTAHPATDSETRDSGIFA